MAATNVVGANVIHYESCRVRISLPPLFADPPAWDARGAVLAMSEPPAYGIRLWRGGSTTILRRSISPSRATPAAVATELGDGEEWVIGATPCVVPAEEVVRQRGVAEYVPIIRRVAVAPDGSVWAMRKVPGRGAGPIDVFDSAGEYIGTLTADAPWPAAFGPEGEVLTMEADDLGVQRVVVYRVSIH